MNGYWSVVEVDGSGNEIGEVRYLEQPSIIYWRKDSCGIFPDTIASWMSHSKGYVNEDETINEKEDLQSVFYYMDISKGEMRWEVETDSIEFDMNKIAIGILEVIRGKYVESLYYAKKEIDFIDNFMFDNPKTALASVGWIPEFSKNSETEVKPNGQKMRDLWLKFEEK